MASVQTASEAETAIARGLPVLTNDPLALTACDAIDILVEVTGTIESGSRCGPRTRLTMASMLSWLTPNWIPSSVRF